MGQEKKLKEIIDYFMSKDILLSEDLAKKLSDSNIDEQDVFSQKVNTDELLVLNDDMYTGFVNGEIEELDWKEFEKFKVDQEKGKGDEGYKRFKELLKKKPIQEDNYSVSFNDSKRISSLEKEVIKKEENKVDQESSIESLNKKSLLNEFKEEKRAVEPVKEVSEKKVKAFQATTKEIEDQNNIKIVLSYTEKSKKRTVDDFVGYFRARFKQMESMFRSRLRYPIVSMNKLSTRSQNDKVSLIGMVNDIRETKNGHLLLNIEDLTGSTNILIVKDKKDMNDERINLYEIAKSVVLDEMIAIDGIYGNEIVFVDNILLAEIPLTKELKKADKEEYMVFLGDPHVGAKNFLKEEFQNMIDWINGKPIERRKILDSDEKEKEISNQEEKDMISKIKYIIVPGDMVEGVGIYPGQEDDLDLDMVTKQFEEFVNYIRQLPSHIQIIISGGNHEPMRIAEPQPPIYKEFAKTLWDMPNVLIISNPGIINIGAKEDFEGFDILIYHGYSFTYYADINEEIRSKGGLTRADLIMQLLLQKRHLAPSHGSTLYIPDSKKDNLVIEKVPDFFITGHIHRLTTIQNYKGITLLNCSTWMSETDFQEKVGLKPQIAKMPIVNLKTRELNIIDFENYKNDG